MIAKGSVVYQGKKFEQGDWFFVPNGVPYEFTTDENEETIVFYTYRFFGAMEGIDFLIHINIKSKLKYKRHITGVWQKSGFSA